MTKEELDRQMVAVVLPQLDPQGSALRTLEEYRAAWTDYALAHQELTDAIRMFLKETVRIEYWVCTQEPDKHVWDFDDPSLIVGDNWRTRGKRLCPSCAGILEQRTAKVSKR